MPQLREGLADRAAGLTARGGFGGQFGPQSGAVRLGDLAAATLMWRR
jgi:hypothetical protein